jgi:hypothetical protein
MSRITLLASALALSLSGGTACVEQPAPPPGPVPDSLFTFSDGVATRWASFENPGAEKGVGGHENQGAKGHPAERLPAGDEATLLDVTGPGIVDRMWITISDRSPRMLRGLRLEMYWDQADEPAVSVPFGDFFGVSLGRTAVFENALFSNPEGRSFNTVIPMPFRTGARIVVRNESGLDLPMLFYDVNLRKVPAWGDDVLYFHAFWQRNPATTLKVDHEILPRVTGRGRYLGASLGVMANPLYEGSWWGEGEVKVYLDGDGELPTLVGTGTEDYIGTGWGQGAYAHRFQGCLIADRERDHWSFYRYHGPDPDYFASDCRVTIQQIGGNQKPVVIGLMEKYVPLVPITIHEVDTLHLLLELDPVPELTDPGLPEGWTNFYRSDDVSSIAYFYLDRPVSGLPALQPVAERVAGLPEAEEPGD